MSEATANQGAPGSPFDDGEIYDALFHSLDYPIAPYGKLAAEAGGPVLDVACGTGRVLLPILQAGIDCAGIDLAEPMLATLRRKAAAMGLTADVHCASMADFDLGRRFVLVMITFNAFIHNLTQADQLRTLECCRRHLAPGGKLVFDTFFPGLAIVGAEQNVRVLEWETTDPRDGRPLRVFDTRSFDRVKQIQTSINEIERQDQDGAWQLLQRSQFDTRYVYAHEMELLLRVAGFSRWQLAADFAGNPLTKETDGMVVSAWAA